MTQSGHPGGSPSARFDRPDLCGALINRDRWKFAGILDRKSTEVIHDRLPFLDFLNSALLRHGVDAGLIHRRARQREEIDLRFERLTLLVFGRDRQFVKSS
jgi:hypothetical protein